ncbi:Cytidine deaminase [Lentibacillus sp. JNUCC-1]|uniref:cytidine deaminase n=1 Tax=Lentibacillus sp. JNUCC-1 TaxID=2654513 RepID=UPI001323CDF9|nr:cytidine deaminase [Lentibacillus sp. JNUCC-1]MUV39808.1 Cytidine deaminase [Lentibacillus sp. JNUCC-1]
MHKSDLVDKAVEAMKQAYVPYSKFPVGAALLTADGTVYTGCNIENAAYPLACCAERVAIFKAISDGCTVFEQLAVTAETDRPVPPCGSCRQVMSEFFPKDMVIHLANSNREVTTLRMEELLPYSFQAEDMDHSH